MLTSYIQSLQLNVDKFSTCTYKLQIGYIISIIMIIVLVFYHTINKAPPLNVPTVTKIRVQKHPLTAAVARNVSQRGQR